MADETGLVVHRAVKPEFFETALADGHDIRTAEGFETAKNDIHRIYRAWYLGLDEYCGGVGFIDRPSYLLPDAIRKRFPQMWITLLRLIYDTRVGFPLRFLEHVLLNFHILVFLLGNDAEFVFFGYTTLSRPLTWYCEWAGISTVCFYGMHPETRVETEREQVGSYDHILSGYDLGELWPEVEDNCYTMIQSASKDSKYTEPFGDDEIDICVVGGFDDGMFRTRTEMLEQLLDRLDGSVSLELYGYSRNLDDEFPNVSAALRGPVYGERFYEIMSTTKIFINIPNDPHIEMDEIRPQGTMEPPAAGTFQLAYDTDRLHELWEAGEEIDVFSSVTQLQEQIEYYLEHEQERERMAARAETKFETEYYGERQIQQTFQDLGITCGRAG
jgi:glycosyltransferase involved in cell wall biosynthesis